MEDIMVVILSLVFWVTPIAFTVHLIIKQDQSKKYKQRLGYVYGGLWAIAFLGYGWLFFK